MKIIVLLAMAACQLSAVSITVKHAAGGTNTYAEDALQTAIDDPLTVCGDIIEIDPGAERHNYYPYVLRGPALAPSLGGPAVPPSYAKDCASSGGKYITIRSSLAYQLTPGKRVGAADAANLAFVGVLPDLTPSVGCTVFTTERAANYWRLQGLNIAATTGTCNQGGNPLVRTSYISVSTGGSAMYQLTDFPHHIAIDQCWIHGIDSYPIRDGVQLEGVSIDLTNSTIENIRSGENESHGITSVSGRGPIRVVNNKISALSIPMFWGGAPSPTKRTVEYVEFSNNWIYRQYKWMDWYGTDNPTPSSPCPVDSDGHGATYRNTAAVTYWECQGASPGTWTSISAGTYNALIDVRIPYPGKNLTEVKSASKMHIEGNVYDQGGQLNLAGQLNSCWNLSLYDGPASDISNITIENNICQHAGWGLIQGQDITANNPEGALVFSKNGNRPLHHLLFRNNLFQHMGEDMYTQPAFGYIGNFQQSVGFAAFGHNFGDSITMDHQTYQSEYTGGGLNTNTGVRTADLSFDPSQPGLNQRVTNSIFTAGRAPVSPYDRNGVARGWGPYAEMASNGIIDNLGLGSTASELDDMRFHCDAGQLGCAYTNAFDEGPANCPGCYTHFKTHTEAKFVDYPDDLTLQSDSPYKAAGLDGRDLGADLNTVGWATVGAQAGTLAPYLAMKIRSVISASTTVAVRFSAIDTSSCTVAARVYGFPLSSPVATSTANTGDLDRTVTLTGLTSGTKYGLRVTCAGTYYREDEFRTP